MNAYPTALPETGQAAGSARRMPDEAAWWRKLLKPSFSDMFFLSLMAWLFMSTPGGWSRVLADGDTGWHIRTGEYILDNLAAPRTDLFSFSRAGEQWFAWEWGADAIFALLHRAGGLKAISIFGGALICLYATVLFRFLLWRGANALLATAFALLAVGASSIHYLARPHLFTLVLVPVSVWMLERDRRERWAGVWLLVPVTAVWVNLHGGFLAAIAIVGLLAAATALQTLFEPVRDWKPALRYAALGGACAAASLVNPYGIQLHIHIASYLRSDWIREAIQEFQSPSFRGENILQFELLLVLGLVACGPLLARRCFAEVLWIVFWAHQALGSMRHITVFVTIAAPIVAREGTLLWERFIDGAPRKSVRRILDSLSTDMSRGFRWTSAWPVIGLAALVLVNRPIQWPTDFPADRFPAAMVSKHAGLIREGRVLTSDQWADYLIYRFYPQMRVYLDGRSDFFGAALGREYVQLTYGQAGWKKAIERHRFDVALLPAEWSLPSLLRQDPDWKLVEENEKAVLFVRVKDIRSEARQTVSPVGKALQIDRREKTSVGTIENP